MIIKLLQTELRSERFLILLAAIASALMWLSETALRSDDTSATFATLLYGQLPFPILFAFIAARKLTQKRERLLAQLPVTGMPVRISSWLSYLVVIAIACLITAVMLAVYPIQIERAAEGRFVSTGSCNGIGWPWQRSAQRSY
jgi:hypothetical protein